MTRFFFRMHQRDEVHLRERAQMAQHVVRADPIAAVGRIRQPVGQEEDPHKAGRRGWIKVRPEEDFVGILSWETGE